MWAGGVCGRRQGGTGKEDTALLLPSTHQRTGQQPSHSSPALLRVSVCVCVCVCVRGGVGGGGVRPCVRVRVFACLCVCVRASVCGMGGWGVCARKHVCMRA